MRRAEEIRERLGIDIPLDVPVESMGAGEQQLVELCAFLQTQNFSY